MADFMITCPACAGFLNSDALRENIKAIPYNYMLDGVIYKYGGEINAPEVFKKIKKGLLPDVAPISVPEYSGFFTEILNSGKNILHIDFSESYSPNYKYAEEAAEGLLKNFPERKIKIIDSARLGLGIFALAKKACDLLKSGKTFDESASSVETLSKNNTDLLVARDLLYLKEKKYISALQKKSGSMKLTEIILAFTDRGVLKPILKTKHHSGVDIVDKEMHDKPGFAPRNCFVGCECNSAGIKSSANYLYESESSIINAVNPENIQQPDISTISKVGLNSFEILCFNELS